MEDQKQKRDKEKIMFEDIIDFLSEQAGLTKKDIDIRRKKNSVENLSAASKKYLS